MSGTFAQQTNCTKPLVFMGTETFNIYTDVVCGYRSGILSHKIKFGVKSQYDSSDITQPFL